jgi:hypothetical protein
VGFPPFFWRLHDASLHDASLHRADHCFSRFRGVCRCTLCECRRLVGLVVFVRSIAPLSVDDPLGLHVHFSVALTLCDVGKFVRELFAGSGCVLHVEEDFRAPSIVHERIDLLDLADLERFHDARNKLYCKVFWHRATIKRRRKHGHE